jgi:methionyl-tRNA synthetase
MHWANATVQAHQPWTLVKSQDDSSQQHLRVVLHVALETLRVCGILFQPMMPELTERLLTRLGVPLDRRRMEDVAGYCSERECTLGDKVTLLKRIHSGR